VLREEYLLLSLFILSNSALFFVVFCIVGFVIMVGVVLWSLSWKDEPDLLFPANCYGYMEDELRSEVELKHGQD